MSTLLHIILFLFGAALVIYATYSAVKNLVLPRSAPDLVMSLVFGGVRHLFNLRLRFQKTYKQRDHLMAFYAPVALVCLLPAWLLLVHIGFTAMFIALGSDWYTAFRISGSSLLTLGFADHGNLQYTILEFIEAVLGLVLIALLIAYLPSIYSAFGRREALVTLLDVRAGSPPSAVELLSRYHRLHGLDQLSELWRTWEGWFADIEESHTSLPALVFFRSPRPEHTWLAASGAVLDAAALSLSVLDIPSSLQAALCIRAGYLAMRHISDFFVIPYHPDPRFPDHSISISQETFEQVLDEFVAIGLPVKADRQQAWQDFAGWRVNYEQPLLALSNLTLSPLTPWE